MLLLLGLNAGAIYIGVSLSGVIGGAVIIWLDRHALGIIDTPFIVVSLLAAG